MSIIQYLKDTRTELRHVAWPTRAQTVIYTTIVILISLFIALYLGFFDFIFTTGLARGLQFLPGAHPAPISTSTENGGVTITPQSTPASPPEGVPSFQ